MLLCLVSCSTKKNTGMSRFWHGFTARYNTYYNGTLAYIDASLEKENGNKDNFTEQLPLYTVSNKASRDLGKANYDIAITKSKKAIQLHSIKTKPEWTKDRRKTAKDIEWLSRKEYNPFLWKAWMLMGRSQFYQGNFDEAAATFSYMSRLYKGQPAIYGKARAWLAKCYVESDWLYDAEDVIRNMQRDSIDWRAQKEWDYTLCDYYLHKNDLPMATEYLRKVISHEMRSRQRAREYYILGQIEAAQGNREEAYKAFRKVISQNPPYQLEFNARISMTEVLAKGQSRKMIGRLKRMARNDNNKEYLDQVYYAIGNIYLADKDTVNAVAAYEKGNEKATRTGVEKGVLLLHLGDIYWQMEKYGDARRCYGEAIGLMDKEKAGYQELSERSKVLDELVPYTDAIHLQDSLQSLAKMDEKERNEAIDRVIDALKKKEKEEAAKAAEQEAEQRQQKYGNALGNKAMENMPAPAATQNRNTMWYFYNPQLVQQGKQAFQRTWGRRENKDNWQRYNKTVVGDIAMDMDIEEADTTMMTEEQRDSVAMEMEKQRLEEEKMDSAVNDPHKREYYMAQIPFTEEAVAESNEIIKDGLYHSAVIFKDKLDNLPLSEKAFKRLMEQFPEFEPKDEMYYHLFLLYSRKGEHAEAQTFVDRMKAECPDSRLTTLLTDPYFADNARFGEQMEDSLYGATYEAFKEDRYSDVYGNAEVSAKRFPLGKNRDRFIFIDGLTHLNDGNSTACLKAMESVVKDYPQSPVAEMAGMIINGVKAGRRLHGAKFDLSDVWNRRNVTMDGADSTANKTFSAERNTDFLFVMAYQPDSIDENKLLFQMAKYNFTSFLVRNFDIAIEDVYGMHHLTVSGFRNFNEARLYAKLLLQQDGIKFVAGKNSRPIVISNENLALIGSRYSYNDYDTFYVKHFAPLPVTNVEQLYEPVKIRDERLKEEDTVRPMLPDDAVAPGGAKPLEPSRNEDSDEEELIALPQEDTGIVVEQQETEVQDAAEPERQDSEMIELEEAAEPVQTEGQTFDVEEVTEPIPADNGGIEVNDAVEEVQSDSQTIEVDDVVEPVRQNDIMIEVDDVADPAPADDVVIELDEPAEQSNRNEDEIIVVEDTKTSTDELEDEYYELDGF